MMGLALEPTNVDINFAMGDTREFLKKSTAAAHRKLDENPLVAGLAGGDLSPLAYRLMLAGYQGFFSSWEPRLKEKFPSLVNELGGYRFEKSAWLAEDLKTLGHLESPPGGEEFPELPEDLAGLAGCLYVVEGSTLGGMHLSRSKHGLPGGANRFFTGYGDETLPAWKRFISWLEENVTTDREQSRAAEMASATFEWFQRRFDAISTQLKSR